MAGFYHSMLGSMGCTSSVGRFQRPVEREQPARFRRRRSRACWAETANSTPKSAPPTTSHGPCNYRPDRIAVAALGCRSCEKRRWEAYGKLLYGILANEPRRGGYGAVGRERCEGVIHFVEDGNVKVAEVAWPWHKACLRQSACNNRREAVEDEIPSALPASWGGQTRFRHGRYLTPGKTKGHLGALCESRGCAPSCSDRASMAPYMPMSN